LHFATVDAPAVLQLIDSMKEKIARKITTQARREFQENILETSGWSSGSASAGVRDVFFRRSSQPATH
jgi:hypothetical protein